MRKPKSVLARMSVSSLAVAAALAAPVVIVPGSALAQAPDEPRGETREELLADFIHFVFIANYDVAGDVGFALLDTDPQPVEFAEMVEGLGEREVERFERAIAVAMRIPELEPIAAELSKRFDEGKLAKARMPDEIEANIQLLTGSLRARTYGRERLLYAGEYAMPQLLETYLSRKNPALRAQVQRVIIDMGRQAVVPLCTALPALDEDRQEAVVDLLGLIPYRTSLPYLTELHQTTNSDAVRQSSARAIARLGGDPTDDLGALYATLSEAYYDERVELTSFEGERFQLLWSFNPGLGLQLQPIDTSVYHEARAMATAESALRYDPQNIETLALWLSSNYSRELDGPEGYENPAYGPERRDASYYAIASGAEVTQRVLRRAIDERDTRLGLRAISAIQRTAGPRLLLSDAGVGRKPLLEALTYPSRRVQYEAAIALGLARPTEAFDRYERVVPLLAAAVEDASARHAIVLAGQDREQYDRIARALAEQGYSVLPPAPNGLADLAGPIAELPGVDLIVTALPLDGTASVRERVANDEKLAATPLLALMRADELTPARQRFLRDELVAIRRSSIDSGEIAASAETLVADASGGVITDEEAAAYADRALSVLRDLAVSGNETLNVEDATAPLVRVLPDAEGERAYLVAEVLTHIGEARAQIAIAEWALAGDGPDRIGRLEKLADSGKRHGNLLTERLERSLVRLASEDDQAIATASVATLGALGIGMGDLVPLIIEQGSSQTSAIVRDR